MKDLIKELKTLGCEIVIARGHYKIFRGGQFLTVTATTPGDQRSLLNAKATLRKLGVPLRRK